MRCADRGESASRSAKEHEYRRQNGRQAALQAARGTESDQLTHDEPEIEPTGMNQEAFQNVRVTAEMRAPHAAGVVEMGERALDHLTAPAHQSASPGSANPPPIVIHRRLGLRLLRPV